MPIDPRKLIGASQYRRERARDALQKEFSEQAKDIADRLVQRGWLSRWEKSMAELIKSHAIAQGTLGAGRELTAAELRIIDGQVKTELAYLSRFAEEIAIDRQLRIPLSEKEIAARSSLYSGTGYGQFYRLNEEEEGGPGYVIHYIALDTAGTCQPCHAAELAGPYAQGAGPMPGQVCLGRGRCRCRRELRYDPKAAERLRERAA